MTIATALSRSIITDSGRAIAAKVLALLARADLEIEDKLALAAELGIEQGREEAVRFCLEAQEALVALQPKYGELPR